MRGILLAVAFVMSWSSGFVGATLGDRAAAPAPLLAWRYLVGVAVLFVVVLGKGAMRRELLRLTPQEWAQQIVHGILAHAVFLGGVFASAAAGLDAGVSSLVCAAQPMVVAAAGRVCFGDRLSQRQIVGLGVGISGVVLSVGGIGASGLGAVWLVVMSLAALSASALLERAWRPTVSVTVSLFVQMASAAVVFTVWAVCTTGLRVQVSHEFLTAVVWLVVISGFGGYAMFTACLRRLGATSTSTLLYLTPAVTMLWAWAMFAETPSVLQVIGLGVVLFGVMLSLMARGLPPGARLEELGRFQRWRTIVRRGC